MAEEPLKDDKPDTGASPDAPVEGQEPSPAPQDSGTEQRGPTGWIPKVRLDEVIREREEARLRADREREERIRLEERLKHDEKKPKELTRRDLNALVAAGEITQDEADSFMEQQIERRITEKTQLEVRKTLEEQTRVQKVSGEIAEYRRVLPTLDVLSSPERLQAERSYADIVYRFGAPKTAEQKLSYELSAIREAFGPISNLERTRKTAMVNKTGRETYNETGGGERPESTVKTDPIKNLSPRMKAHYEKMIAQGRYKDMDEVRAELQWEKPKL